ncbi:MAG: hypothetical protein LUH11_02055 [Candidatus Gastranaerophilales bacterium]|nr:hypothetical protein [Candidatus Gastranaerophilales bacterium]
MLLYFNSVNLISNKNEYTPERKPQIKDLKSDTFVKNSNNVSFKGSSGFIDWAEKTDFIHTQLRDILSNSGEKIGSGFSHSAFSIAGNDDFILRMSNSDLNNVYNYESALLRDCEDKKLKVDTGQKVADIEIKDEHNLPHRIQVLRKQKGEPLGVAPPQAVFNPETGDLRDGELPYESLERKHYYASTIHKTAQLPVKSYERLIDDIQNAANAGYTFDHLNSNNFLIDCDEKAINIIDMNKADFKADYGNVLYALTNIDYYSTFASKYDNNPVSDEELNQAITDTMKIIEKFIKAMQNKNVKFKNRREFSYEFMKLFISLPFDFYLKTMDDDCKWERLEQLGVVDS